MVDLQVSKCWLFLITFCLVACSSSNGAPDLSVKKVKSDLHQLQTELETFHVGYDWYTSRESLTRQFDEAIENAQPTNDVAFFGLVRRLLAQVRCGHTRASMPETERLVFESSTRFMPLSVMYSEKAAFIKKAAPNSQGLETGDQVIAVNGRTVSELVETIFDHLSADGFNETLKYQLTASNFSYFFSLFVDNTADQYQLDLMRNDVLFSVELSGVSIHELLEINGRTQHDQILELTENQDYHYLRISSFGSSTINRADQDYYPFLTESFAQIAAAPKPVILDLRGNGGGDDLYGAKLVSYFLDKPFRYFDKIEVTKAYSSYGNIEETTDTRLMTSHDGLNLQQPSANAFNDSLFVLVDGRSFSTCADVASVLRANDRGVFIGEETGGGAGGNTSGNSKSITLTHSGIRVNVPMWKYTTAPDSNRTFGRGVIPDIELTQETDNLVSPTDQAIEIALELIRQN